MFTNRIASYYSPGKVLIEAACLSTDTKPTTGVANGSKCIEMDTGKTYMFNEEDSEWEELPSSGGGGGSSDFSTAEVTITGDGGFFSLYIADNAGQYSAIFKINDNLTFDSPEVADEASIKLMLYYLGNEAICIPAGEVTSVIGDAVYDAENSTLTITGDCTIAGFSN